jgi:hypothetical protein
MTSTASRTTPRATSVGATTLRATTLACAALLLAACGSSAGGSTSSASTTTSATQQTGGPGGGQGRFPGVSGLVAAVQGRTLQVQDASSQTAVTWAAGTAFTRVVPTTAGAVKVGSCVQVRSSGQQPAGSTPATRLVAASVMVSAPVKGTCSVGAAFGGRGGGTGQGAGAGQGGARPDATRTGGPGRGGFGGGFGVVGTVASVGGSSFVVTATVPQRGGGGTATATPGTAPRTVTVTTTATTTYTTTVPATAAAATVGTCVTARGRADSTGAIAATAITVRPAVGGQCTGFGRPSAGSGRG